MPLCLGFPAALAATAQIRLHRSGLAHDRSADSFWSDPVTGAGGKIPGRDARRLSHFEQSAAFAQSNAAAFAVGGKARIGSGYGGELSAGGGRAVALAAGESERVADLEMRAVSWKQTVRATGSAVVARSCPSAQERSGGDRDRFHLS